MCVHIVLQACRIHLFFFLSSTDCTCSQTQGWGKWDSNAGWDATAFLNYASIDSRAGCEIVSSTTAGRSSLINSKGKTFALEFSLKQGAQNAAVRSVNSYVLSMITERQQQFVLCIFHFQATHCRDCWAIFSNALMPTYSVLQNTQVSSSSQQLLTCISCSPSTGCKVVITPDQPYLQVKFPTVITMSHFP